jgi:hypothetical protein
VEIPQIEYSAPLSKAVEKMRYEDSQTMAVMRKGKLAGVLLAPHVESIIALHMQHYLPKQEKPEKKSEKQEFKF